MRNILPFLATLAIVGALTSGCSSAEKKFGRGVSNMAEIARLGEIRRSVEQTTLFANSSAEPGAHYTAGFVHGLNKTLARTGLGVFEVVTAPFPPYDPLFTNYLKPYPQYPDNYKPDIIDDSLFATDNDMGFSGVSIAPWIPGSRFTIFNSP
jgi:putative exosortase-associated protein (TIGR04073 family)